MSKRPTYWYLLVAAVAFAAMASCFSTPGLASDVYPSGISATRVSNASGDSLAASVRPSAGPLTLDRTAGPAVGVLRTALASRGARALGRFSWWPDAPRAFNPPLRI